MLKTVAEEVGTKIVGCVAELAELVCRARELPGDGTRVAGFVARELLERGAHVADGSAHPLRWALTESPVPKDDPLGFAGAVAVVGVLVAALRRVGGPPDTVLALAARHWTQHDTKPEAERAVLADGRASSDAVVRQAERAHAKRLADAPPARAIVDVDPGAWEEGERVFGGADLVPVG